MIKRLCCVPCCSHFCLEGSDFCERHQNLQQERDKRSREYFESFRKSKYSDLFRTKRWRDLRAEHLRQHPYCEVCGSSENLQVHHRYPNGVDYSSEELFFNPDVLETLCTSCHAKETIRRTGRKEKD